MLSLNQKFIFFELEWIWYCCSCVCNNIITHKFHKYWELKFVGNNNIFMFARSSKFTIIKIKEFCLKLHKSIIITSFEKHFFMKSYLSGIINWNFHIQLFFFIKCFLSYLLQIMNYFMPVHLNMSLHQWQRLSQDIITCTNEIKGNDLVISY